MEEEIAKDIKMEALKYGFLVGMVGIILLLLAYILDPALLVNWKFSLGSLITVVALSVYFVKKYRNEERDGFLEFKEAFFMGFILLLVANLTSASFQILLYNVIDPEVAEIVIDQTLESTEVLMRSMGLNDEQIDEALDKLEEDIPKSFSVGGILRSSWVYAVSALVLGLIVGAIAKKSKPDFDY